MITPHYKSDSKNEFHMSCVLWVSYKAGIYPSNFDHRWTKFLRSYGDAQMITPHYKSDSKNEFHMSCVLWVSYKAGIYPSNFDHR